ncbi:type VII secretion integral membrane protein EccD [Mycobacterium antarcticum]|nr:type VII secretion integral membrane protein EccD [Mycolicibacterium sp. TUM20985]
MTIPPFARSYGEARRYEFGGDPVSVSRVSIQADRDGHPVAVDVSLPSAVPVADLLPAIVELVDDRALGGDTARRWRLDRLLGGTLEDWSNLRDNGIRDGDVLVLVADGLPELLPMRGAPCQVAAEARAPATTVDVAGIGCGLAALLAATAFASTAGSDAATLNAMLAAVCAVAAAAVTIATRYATAPSLATVLSTSAAGFLAVPSGPAAPNAFLAATASACASLLLLRLSGRASAALTATTTGSLVTAIVTVVAIPPSAAGAALATLALAVLALAPRASVLVTGLGPESWQSEPADRARAGHAVLSGLVVGSAAGSACGVAVVAIVADAVSNARASIFATVVGAVLLLRSRTYVDPVRRNTLSATGLACVIAGLLLVVATHPARLGMVAGLLLIAGLSGLRRPTCGATASRMLDRLEYVALAAVVPTACWVAGAYAAVGGFPAS